MEVKIIKNIKKLIELLSSLFKKNLSGEYYINKNINSIFYFNDYVQEEQTENISKEDKLLKVNSPCGNISPTISCDAKEPKNADTSKQPQKLSNNPNFLKFKQELENRLKNSLESNSKNEEQKEKQACKEDVLPLISNSENISALSVKPEIKPVVFSDDNPSIPPPPPIGGLVSFKGLKLPLSSPIQEQSRTKQEEPCDISQNKRSNLNNLFVEELKLKLEKRKVKAHSI